jgi:hypothetical protein
VKLHTHECNFWTQSVISTRTSVIYIRRVWFIYVECDLFTKSVIFTRRAWFLNTECNFYTHRVILTRSVWFLRAECSFQTQYDVETQKFDYETLSCDFNTHKSDLYTQRFWYVWVWLRQGCDLHTHEWYVTR